MIRCFLFVCSTSRESSRSFLFYYRKYFFLYFGSLWTHTSLTKMCFFLQRNLLKCKTFCIVEVILICCKFIFLIIRLSSIGHSIYSGFITGIRLFGVKIIGEFITRVHLERGEETTFPWNYFPQQQKQVDSIYYTNPEVKLSAPI